ncbi:MAG: BLUF domain-containing protein [Gammaproteobacteria bacterium]|nr:BLUF domain-containing protein [Gammaproteobacteria bacterium]MBU1556862.1 BLUF domain-containing protein [Gammaproteobacteria bacterium]MBU2071076.1 BLUF domain-containing protein [Gammaproteobacteria bacterium]MBU2184344.1 BLUF domain-containing protein [Gammaproteobacteria bacterium]MBU2206399.1 BLUF domain-containing protein [Gammaproteobacteria bacterium]
MTSQAISKDEIQLVYLSERCANTDEAAINKIKLRAEHNNHRRNITGALLFTEHYFLQYLEGEAAIVDALYASICRDKRHTNARLLLRKPITQRDFSRWSLGVKKLLDNEENQDLIAVLNMIGQASKVTESQLDWFKLALQ